jgi:hypothetical protein
VAASPEAAPRRADCPSPFAERPHVVLELDHTNNGAGQPAGGGRCWARPPPPPPQGGPP